ncbi:MAG: hypothetical protein OEW09_06190 [Anaerolineae bacterium]|nr:hypothetical protein [Anaerolineae bacterium]
MKTMRVWSNPSLIVILTATLYLGIILSLHYWDLLAFVLPGTRFTTDNPLGSEGYDGQFVYQIALRPTEAMAYLDVPAYRYQRIFYPLLARWLALAQPALIPWTLPLINLAALGIGTGLAGRLLERSGTSPWFALPVGLFAGQLLALRVDLPEPLALALALGGGLIIEQTQQVPPTLSVTARARTIHWSGLVAGAALFALSALTKETMLLTAAGYGLYLGLARGWRPALLLSVIAAGPFLLWQGVLWLWLGQPGIGSGGAGATPFELIPFSGLLRTAEAGWKVFALFALIMLPLAVLPSLWSLWASVRDICRHQWHPRTFALLANAFVIPFLPFSTFREPLAMLRFLSPLVAMVVLFGGAKRSRRVLMYSLLWLASAVFLLKDVS